MAFLITNKHQSKANERGSLKKHICTAILSIFSAQASCSLLSILSAQASCSLLSILSAQASCLLLSILSAQASCSLLSILSAQASCSLLSMLSAQASCSQNFVQAQDQLRPLNGSVDLILKNGVHETNLSLDPTKWMNFIMLVIDISCTTMHCG